MDFRYPPLQPMSDIGYLSILSWVCAQFPQIVTNYQNSSVEGIAPLFLTSWFIVLSLPKAGLIIGRCDEFAWMYLDSSTSLSDVVGMLLRRCGFGPALSICSV